MPVLVARRFGLILFVFCLLTPALGWAQSYSVLIDTDQDASTGCTVSLPATGAVVSGVERRLSATVTANGQTVNALTLAECDTGQFGTANPLPGTPYPVNLDGGINGTDVVELAASTAAIAAQGSTIQLYFVAETTGSDDLLATLNGSDTGAPIVLTLADEPIPIPGVTGSGLLLLALLMLGVAAWQFRRRGAPRALSVLLVSLTGVALAAAPNGDLSEWLDKSPIATDPSGDSSANTDIVAAFAAEAIGGVLCFRLDIVDTEATTGGNTSPAFTSTPVTTASPGSLYTYNITSTDPDAGDTLALTAITLPTWLNLTDNGDGSGTLSGTPTAADAGANAVQLRVTDSNGGFATQSFTVTVGTATNTPPVANPQNVNTDEDQAVTITLTGSDADGDNLTFALASGPSNGTLSSITQLSSTSAEVTYTPTPNFSGDDSFTFTVNDGTENSAAATVTISIGGNNDPPIANPLSQNTPEDTPITLTLSGSDPDGDALAFSVASGPSNGTLSAITPLTDTTAEITYTPNLNFNGSDSFTFTVNDGSVNSPAATVSITIGGVNDPPTANPLAQTTPEDTPITLTLSGSDPDGDALTFSVVSGPSNGILSAITPLTDTTAEITYTPNLNFNGSDSFTFQVDDGNGGTDTAAVDITIDPFNDNPVANAQMLNTNEDIDLPIVLTGSDLDGDVLTFNIISGPSNGTLSAIIPIDDTSADITYTPDLDFNGSDSFTFEVDDGNGGTATAVVDITINPQADEPVANAQMLTMDEDTSLMIILTGSDPDGDTLDFTIVSGPTSGLLSPIPPTPIDATSADITYTPNMDFNGTDSFVFQVDDGNGGLATATVDITINAVNDPPIADAQTVTTDEDTALVITLTGSDVDLDALTFAIDTDPTNGSLGAITQLTDTSAEITYTPTADFGGADSFTFIVNDGTVDSAAATVNITVEEVNDAPSFTPGPDQTVLENAGAQTVAGWATAIDDGDGGTQVLTFNVTNNTNAALFSAGPAIDATTGNLTYTPAANTSGSADITIELMDDGGTANGGVDTSSPVTFTINVTDVNGAPSFTAGPNQTVVEDAGAQIVAGWATNIDDGDGGTQTLTFNITGNTNTSLFSAGPAIDATTGTLTYTPADDAFGSASVTVTLSDDGSNTPPNINTSAPQTFTITVDPVNDPPVITGQNAVNTPEDTARTIIFADLTVTDPDNAYPTGFILTVSDGANYTRSGNTITPVLNFNGILTVPVVVNDGTDDSNTFNLSVTVTPVNDPPNVTPPAAYAAHAHIGISIPDGATDLLDGSTIADVDGAGAAPFSLTAGGFTSTNGGTGTVNANGSFAYDPPAGFTGTDTFTYQICDSGIPAPSACTDATATVEVSGPRVWFVNNAGAAGDGRLSAPFNTLAAADTAANANGDRIFVFTGGSAYTGGFTLQDSQSLVGQGVVDTNFDTALGITPPANSVARPTINGTRPVINGTITLASNIIARGFNVNNTIATGVTGNGATGLTINQVSVTTTTGTAVNLANSGGTASFTSISANGAINGILLNNTTGSFTVTSDLAVGGSRNGTGGTINNTDQGIVINSAENVAFAHMNITNTTGDGGFTGSCDSLINTGCKGAINLNSVSNVRLDNMQVTNAAEMGVNAISVTDFTMVDSHIIDAGDADEEHGIQFENLFGTSLIENSLLDGTGDHMEDGIELINTTVDNATTDVLTIRNTIIRANATATTSTAFGENGILVRAQGNAKLNLNVEGGTIELMSGDGINAGADGAPIGSDEALLTVNVTGTTIQDIVRGFSLANANGQNAAFAILDGTSVTRTVATPIIIVGNQDGDITGTIGSTDPSNGMNDITVAGTRSSAGTTGVGGILKADSRGIWIIADDQSNVIVAINNTTIRDNIFSGINLSARNSAIMNATISSNVVTGLGTNAFEEGILVQAGVNTAGDTGSVCLDMFDNNSSNHGFFDDYRLRTRLATNTFELQDFTGTGNSVTDVQDWVTNVKTNIGTVDVVISAPFSASVGACSTP